MNPTVKPCRSIDEEEEEDECAFLKCCGVLVNNFASSLRGRADAMCSKWALPVILSVLICLISAQEEASSETTTVAASNDTYADSNGGETDPLEEALSETTTEMPPEPGANRRDQDVSNSRTLYW